MRKPSKKPFVKRQEEEQHRINGRILVQEIRLVMEGEEPQVVKTGSTITLISCLLIAVLIGAGIYMENKKTKTIPAV